MNTEESLARSLKEIGVMIATLTGAIQEIDASMKVSRRGAGITKYDVGGIMDAANNLCENFRSRLD